MQWVSSASSLRLVFLSGCLFGAGACFSSPRPLLPGAAAAAREPLAHWTQTFMGSAAQFVAQFFPIFLLGALFGKQMDDSGSVQSIAKFMSEKSAPARDSGCRAGRCTGHLRRRESFRCLFCAGADGTRAIPGSQHTAAADAGGDCPGNVDFHHVGNARNTAIQNTIPMPFFGTTPFAAPGLGIIASAIMLAFGLWWLGRAESSARRSGEGCGEVNVVPTQVADDQFIRERATAAHEFDPAEIAHGKHADTAPSVGMAIIPLLVVVAFNLLLSISSSCRVSISHSWPRRWGGTSLAAVAGVWSVAVALAAASATLIVINWQRLPDLRASMDAGANGRTAHFCRRKPGRIRRGRCRAPRIRDGAGLGAIDCRGTTCFLAIATNVLAALTGSASGGLTIALDALGATYLRLAAETGIDPLMHRIAVIGSGTLDSLPHNGAVVTLLAVCGSTHRKSYFDMVMANIVGPILAWSPCDIFRFDARIVLAVRLAVLIS